MQSCLEQCCCFLTSCKAVGQHDEGRQPDNPGADESVQCTWLPCQHTHLPKLVMAHAHNVWATTRCRECQAKARYGRKLAAAKSELWPNRGERSNLPLASAAQKRAQSHPPVWRNWQTQRIQNPSPFKGVWVQVPPPALPQLKRRNNTLCVRLWVFAPVHRAARKLPQLALGPDGHRPPHRCADLGTRAIELLRSHLSLGVQFAERIEQA